MLSFNKRFLVQAFSEVAIQPCKTGGISKHDVISEITSLTFRKFMTWEINTVSVCALTLRKLQKYKIFKIFAR